MTNDEITIETAKTNIVLDSQILSTIMSCGRLTDFRFNMHLQSIDGKSSSLEMGSVVHSVLEAYNKALIAGSPRDAAIGAGFIAGRRYIAEEVKNLEMKDSEYAIETCAQYFEHYKNDSWIPLEAEVVKGEILYEDSEIRILYKAKLDVIVDTNQGIYPVDHKTMKQRRDTVSLNNQFIGQCILTKTRGVLINKIGFQTSLKPSEKFQRVLVPYTAQRLIEWQSEILPYWAKMLVQYNETGYYPPNFTHCESKYGICPFKNVCESDPSMRDEVLRNEFVVGEEWNPTND